MKNKTKNKTVVGGIQTGRIFMKKYLIIVALAGISAFFTACEKDEPKNPVDNPVDNKKTVNLKVAITSRAPGANKEQLFTKTLSKDTLNKIFSDVNVGKIEIELIGANNLTSTGTAVVTMAVDSLYQAKTLFGDKVVIREKELYLNQSTIDGFTPETLQKLQILGLTLKPYVAVAQSFKQRYGQTVAQLMERSKVRGA